jgi:hypothetical protein
VTPGGGSLPSTPTGPATPQTPLAVCAAKDPGPAVIRRLNRFEYSQTVRDLLGETGDPAAGFPTEERRNGFDNNAIALTVSPVLAEQYLTTAEQLARSYLDRQLKTLPAQLGCAEPTSAAAEDACADKFIASMGKRAYRRPVSAEDVGILRKVYQGGRQAAVTAGKPTEAFRSGLMVALAAMLQAPRFLYRVEESAAGTGIVPADSWELASRLSYLIGGTAPDAELSLAAEQGRLATGEQIAAQVQRLMGTPSARAMVGRFHKEWLEVESLEAIEKDAKVYPTFTNSVLASMNKELDAFLDTVFWDRAGGDIGSLFSAPYTFVDATLSKYYGMTAPAGSGMQKVILDGKTRGGILTQGGLLAAQSPANQTSPVRRGKFVREQLICQNLPPPPPGAVVVLPALDPKLSTRERFARHSTDPACSGCHSMMDPIGLGFENYDGAGRYRDSEAGRPIDASGEVKGATIGVFTGLLGLDGLGAKIAASREVRSCVVRQWFRYAFGRDEGLVDSCALDALAKRFTESNGNFRDLLVALTETDAFRAKRAGGGAP